MKRKNKRNFIKFLLTIIILILAIGLNNYLDLRNLILLDLEFLFTYLGVFIGFAITIYTYGISILNSIETQINSIRKKNSSEIKKANFYKSIKSGFEELKNGIIILIYSFLFLIFSTIILEIQICYLTLNHIFPKISLNINLTILILSLVILRDLILSMFSISEISLYLLNQKKKK